MEVRLGGIWISSVVSVKTKSDLAVVGGGSNNAVRVRLLVPMVNAITGGEMRDGAGRALVVLDVLVLVAEEPATPCSSH